MALPGARQRYRWADSAASAVAGVRDRFAAASWRERLDLLKRDGARDPALQREMVAALAEQAGSLRKADPAAALEVALALERAGAPLGGDLTPEALLRRATIRCGCSAPPGAARARRAIAACPRARRLADRLREGAAARGGAEGARPPRRSPRRRCAAGVNNGPASTASSASCSPRRARARPPSPGSPSAPRATSRCCSATRCASSSRSSPSAARRGFATHRKRLLKIADSGGTLPRLLPLLEPAQAAQAEEAVGKAPGLEQYQREALKNAIHLRFPELRQEAEQPLYATPEAIVAKKDELRQSARGGDPRQPQGHRGGARPRRPARELRVQERPPAPRVPGGPRRRPAPRPRPRAAHRGREGGPLRGARRHPRRACAAPAGEERAHHPARPLGQPARGGHPLPRVRPRHEPARQGSRRQRGGRRQELRGRRDPALQVAGGPSAEPRAAYLAFATCTPAAPGCSPSP